MAKHDVDPVLRQLVRAVNESAQAGVADGQYRRRSGLMPLVVIVLVRGGSRGAHGTVRQEAGGG